MSKMSVTAGLKAAGDYAPGIPDPNAFGDVLGTLKPGDTPEYVLQRHETVRNPGHPHYDLRLGTPETNLFSWAVPNARLPEPGQTVRPTVQTHLHAFPYGNFTGKIGPGYGHGTVSMADRGKAVITRVSPNTLHFTVAHSRVPTRYVLIHIGGRDGRAWQLYAKPSPGKIPGVGDKPVHKQISADSAEEAMAQAVELQQKLDGAHGVVHVGPKGDIGIFSVRPSVRGEPIEHTERMQLFGHRVPPRFRGRSYRGELLFTDANGRALPFKDVSALLNMTIAKSLERQRKQKLRPRVALFSTPANRADIRDLLKELPSGLFMEPARANTPEAKRSLVQAIAEGRDPMTAEGVMAVMPDGSVRKLKNKEEATGYLTGTYPGTGKRKDSAGGLTFTTGPGSGSSAEGRVGTGFTDTELRDIVARLEELKGQPMRIQHMGRFASGKLRAPSFKGFETDKPAEKRAIVQRRGKGFVLLSHKGKVLGHHGSRASAMRQERAIMAHKYGEALPQFIQQALFHGDRELLARAGRARTPAKRLAAQIRGYYRSLPRQEVAQHMQHPDIQHVLSWDGAVNNGKIAAAHPFLKLPRLLGAAVVRNLRRMDRNATVNKVVPKGVIGDAARDVVKHPVGAAVGVALGHVPPLTFVPGSGAVGAILGAKTEKMLGRAASNLRKYAQAPERVTLRILGRNGIVKASVAAELAFTPASRRLGLGGHAPLAEGEGMLFDKSGTYWMKDVEFPLDIVFLGDRGDILQKQAMPVERDPSAPVNFYKGPDGAAHALELPLGWCDRQNVGIGDRLTV